MSKRKIALAAEVGGAKTFSINELLAINQRSINAMTQLNAQIPQIMMSVHSELLDFTNRRLTADIEVAQKLTRGGNLGDAVEAVCGFQRQVVADYADEAREVVKIVTSMAGELVQEIEGDVNERAAEQSDLVNKGSSTAGNRPIREIENVVEASADDSSDVKKRSSIAAGRLIREIKHGVNEGIEEVSETPGTGRAPHRQQAVETSEESAKKAPVITLNAPPKKSSEPDLQKAILRVLSGKDEALALTEIARQIGTVHYAALIRPMRSLCTKGRVVKEDKTYRLT